MLDRLTSHFIDNFTWSLGVITDPEQARLPQVRRMFVTDEFLISDNPVINFKHVKVRAPIKVSLEFALPVTPHHIVILRDNNYPGTIENDVFRIDRNQIRVYNEYQYKFSKRFIFFSKGSNKSKIKNFFKYNPKEETHNSGSFCVLPF